MFSQKLSFLPQDLEAARMLGDFLPERIFDAHAHLFDTNLIPSLSIPEADRAICGVEEYCAEIGQLLCAPRELRLNIIGYPEKKMAYDRDLLMRSDAFLCKQLADHPKCVGEIIITPEDTEATIEQRLTSSQIVGLKCYHYLAKGNDTWNASISEYLPEAAWEIANQKKLCITLHMVKDKALADEDNWRYIQQMSKQYPDAVLILAHAARAFAAWTGIESVEKVAHLDNVWFDFSAVCESPAMLQIIKKAGISRCMWGSDYPVCRSRGKAISLADTFYWINRNDLDRFSEKTPINNWLIALENLMAVRQMSILADLTPSDVEALFYNNAKMLFER